MIETPEDISTIPTEPLILEGEVEEIEQDVPGTALILLPPVPEEETIWIETEDIPVLQPRKRLMLVGTGIMSMLLLLSLCVFVIVPWFFPTADITITPQVLHLSASFVPQGLQKRSASATQSEIVQTTGTGHTDATRASGIITFLNTDTVQKIIGAGTLLIGKDGIQVATDSDLFVPVGYPVGEARVRAHAVQAGQTGNISALDISGACCQINVSARNFSGFTGGQDARTFQTVAQKDIDGARQILSLRAAQMAQSNLKTGPSEEGTAPTCISQSTASTKVENETDHFTENVKSTCTEYIGDLTMLQNQAEEALQKEITAPFHLEESTLHFSLLSAREERANVLTVATWTQEELANYAKKIAGMHENNGLTFLSHEPGIVGVSYSINGRNTGVFPSDPARIHFHMMTVLLPIY